MEPTGSPNALTIPQSEQLRQSDLWVVTQLGSYLLCVKLGHIQESFMHLNLPPNNQGYQI